MKSLGKSMNKSQAVLASALIGCALTALSAAPASATPTQHIDLYGSVTTTMSLASGYSGDNLPGIDHTGGLKYSTSKNNRFDQYLTYAKPITSYSQSSLLYTVDPATCMKGSGSGSGCKKSGTEKVNFDNVFAFYASQTSTNPLGTIDVTALATFIYQGGDGIDNYCWNNTPTATGGVTIVSHTLVGSCPAPGTNPSSSQFGFEEIIFTLAGNYFQMNLYDWSDWNEQPHITLAWIDPTTIPEPASVTVLGAGLLGFGAFIRRRKKTA